MSQADFKEFITKVNTDETLRSALQDRFDTGTEIPAEDLIAFAGQKGYSFSVDEAEEELTDEALEGVAGGASYLKIQGIEGESTSLSGDYLKIKYSPTTTSFNFIKLD